MLIQKDSLVAISFDIPNYVASDAPAPLSRVDLSNAYGINSESVVRDVFPFGCRQITSISPNSDKTCLHAPVKSPS